MKIDLQTFRKYGLADSLASYRINSERFDILIALVNEDGQVMPISKGAVSSLLLQDNIFDLALTGSIVIENTSNSIQKFADPSDSTGKSLFQFKNNGRDYLVIQIRPIISGDGASDVPKSIQDYVFIEERFVIYSISEVNANTKYLKLDFHTVEMQMLVEENSMFSTASDKQSNAPDVNRKLPVGTALKEALKTLFPATDLSITDWEVGKYSIFYTASCTENMFQTLSNMVKYCVSSNDSPCFLKKNLVTKKIELLSLESIFKKAVTLDGSCGERFVNAYMIDTQDNIKENSATFLAVKRPSGVRLSPSNIIENFTLEHKDYSTTFASVKSQLVNSYDKQKGAFAIRNTPVEKIASAYETQFVKPFSSLGTAKSNIEINEDMKKNNFFVSKSESRTASAITQGNTNLLHSMLFLNSEATFTVRGTTFLKSGYFIHIEPSTRAEPNDFNKSIVGIYLLTKVEHIFNGETFKTKVSAVKTYTL